MTFKERIDREKGNLTEIVLHNDRGLFFCLVERSAYAFHTRIKPFKANVKTLKGLDAPYVSIGVPVNKAEEYLSGLSFNKDEQGNIIARLDEPIDEQAFQAWKQHVISLAEEKKRSEASPTEKMPDDAVSPSPSALSEEDNIILDCAREVKMLNIASMTPMDAILFLSGLQQKLKDVNL